MAENIQAAPKGRLAGSGIRLRQVVEFAHPEYTRRVNQWRKIRDCFEGEDRIKEYKSEYLPTKDSQESQDYTRYLERAVFVNFVARSIDTLTSAVFRRKEILRVPRALNSFVKRATDDGINLRQLSRWAVQELCLVSRAGLLLDLPSTNSSSPEPYLSRFPTEDIISWGPEAQPRWILLRECNSDASNLFAHDYKHSYLLLALDDNGDYCIARPSSSQLAKIKTPVDLFTQDIKYAYPEVFGKRLKKIPFWFLGALENTSHMPKPLMLDIANLNLAHYRNYADLETGRHYTGFPIYVIKSDDDASDEEDGEAIVKVSPHEVWELGQDDDALILEFTGGGLNSLENGLAEKEEHMRSMGATILSARANAAARSNASDEDTAESRDATLSDIVESISSAVTEILETVAQWRGAPTDTIMFFLNRHFNVPGIGARELRVLVEMVGRGILPRDLYLLFKDAGWLSETTTEDEFVQMINTEIIEPRKALETTELRQARADARLTNAEARQTKEQTAQIGNAPSQPQNPATDPATASDNSQNNNNNGTTQGQ